MPERGSLLPFLVVLGLVAAGCTAPDASRVPMSEAANAAPPPRLVETAQFDAVIAGAAPTAERLGADADDLAARAAALRTRAAALGGPVIDPAIRPRIEAVRAPAGG